MRMALGALAAMAQAWPTVVGAPTEDPSGVITRNERVPGYRGIWYFNQKSGDEYVYKYSGGLGTYCAKHRPFAVYCPQVQKTFFCYGGAAPDDNRRLWHMVSYYSHRTGQVPQPTLLLDKQTDDAHDNPVISVDADGYVWIFSTSHGRGRPSFVHRSSEPYSIDRFERVDAVRANGVADVPLDNFSYMQVYAKPAGGFHAFFTRYGDPAARTLMFIASSDGRRWSPWQRLAAIEEGHYHVSQVAGPRAAVAFNYHPAGTGLNYRTNLYYLETADGGQTWQTAAGETVNVPLTTVDNPTLVRDYAAAGKHVYVKDLVFDAAGRPAVLAIVSGGYESGPANDPREWILFRWTGVEWTTTTITASDSNYDMGELRCNGRRWELIAPTATGPQPYNPGGEMCLHESDGDGRTWRLARQLTGGSRYNHTYARRPVNAHDDFVALWADGHARQPSESRLYFCNSHGEVFQLPPEMSEEFATPQEWQRAR